VVPQCCLLFNHCPAKPLNSLDEMFFEVLILFEVRQVAG
jgi:hypothetical protein